jgi:FKBP-type peptidyl-prolyl cis-trans isomerase FklB
MDKVSYALGLGIGRQLSQMGAEGLNIDDFAQAIKDVVNGKEPQVGDAEAQKIVQEFFENQEKKQRAAAAEKYKDNKEKGEAWLADNAKKEGVTVLPSGLQYQVIKEGNGRQPKASDSVKCHYEGMLTDGTLFDSSLQRGEPATFPLSGVIAGWTEGLQLMKEGAKYRFFIPYHLAYGEHGAGQQIPPYSALVFDVELIEVK